MSGDFSPDELLAKRAIDLIAKQGVARSHLLAESLKVGHDELRTSLSARVRAGDLVACYVGLPEIGYVQEYRISAAAGTSSRIQRDFVIVGTTTPALRAQHEREAAKRRVDLAKPTPAPLPVIGASIAAPITAPIEAPTERNLAMPKRIAGGRQEVIDILTAATQPMTTVEIFRECKLVPDAKRLSSVLSMLKADGTAIVAGTRERDGAPALKCYAIAGAKVHKAAVAKKDSGGGKPASKARKPTVRAVTPPKATPVHKSPMPPAEISFGLFSTGEFVVRRPGRDEVSYDAAERAALFAFVLDNTLSA